MFCPRFGRAVNENANFCGGCGLSRVEIEKFAAAAKVNNEAAQQAPANNTAEVKSEVPFGTVVNDTVQPAENCGDAVKETVAQMLDGENPQPAEAPKAEAEAPKAETTAETSYTYTAPKGAEYHYSAADGSYKNVTQSSTNSTGYSYTAPAAKNENLSTVDFIWMMLISSIPVVGHIYIIYLAIQNDNTNKRSYARATLIISVFATVVAFVFALGFIIAGL